nr:uncharacterized protein LOC113691366 [Coffea arabica]
MVVVEAMHKAGGMALFWKDELKILEVLMTSFTIEAHVEDMEANTDWWFIGIYASCDHQIRKEQWKVLANRKRLWGDRWMIAGDFNDLVSNDEKWGGIRREEKSFHDFRDFINGNYLLDIGFIGHPWTWCNNWEEEGEVKQRLDRGLCTYPWFQVFDKVNCRHIDSYASDHSILMFDTMMSSSRRKHRFFFDKRWLKREDIGEVIRIAWEQQVEGSRMYQVATKIKNCRVALLKWKNNFQANSRDKIELIKKQLCDLKEVRGNSRNISMAALKKELSKAYKEEEKHWQQKSRIQWLKEGDKNTKFFHASVQGRRRRNSLHKLQREDGTWTESEEELSTEIAGYYRILLDSNEGGDLNEVLHGIPHTITDELNRNLLKPVLEEEIKSVIFSMNPEKAPGIDDSYISKAIQTHKQILDNIMVSHEYMHYLKNKKQGKDGFMAVKLDMSKAYDRVEWSFLEAIMEKMGFDCKWRNWVMECVKSVSYSFNINGEVKEFVIPKRGIRQGDPLSPYLFLLCSEGLSNLIRKAADSKKLAGMQISRQGPSITHLLFADDSVIFCKANLDQANELRRVLKVYGMGLGQEINLEKSSILFSKNVRPQLMDEICQTMGNMQRVSQGKYLGLPMVVSGSKQQLFGFIKTSIHQRMLKWKNRLLSAAGKETMLKSVALAMPTYTMSCFQLPSKLCKEISSLMANYWWGEANGKNKIHWCAWKKLTRNKYMGGLGFKDLMAYNTALLGKQVWRMLTQPNLLVSQVMKAKYFPRSSIFKCKVPNNASWIWRSLMGARELVEQGTRRKIGNGRKTNIWEDRWIPDTLDGRVTTPRNSDNALQQVHELICQKRWNRNLVFKHFNKKDAETILTIPVSLAGKEDANFWIKGAGGHYSVSSGYKLLVMNKDIRQQRNQLEGSTTLENQSQRLWKDLWKLKVKQKQKVWRRQGNY